MHILKAALIPSCGFLLYRNLVVTIISIGISTKVEGIERDAHSSDEFRNLKGVKHERMIVERKVRKLSQAQLGKKVGCSVAMIGAIESGRATLGLEVSMKDVPATRFKNPG